MLASSISQGSGAGWPGVLCRGPHMAYSLALDVNRAKNWRSHGHQWRVKTDQGHQELTVKRPMCDYATEFRKVAI